MTPQEVATAFIGAINSHAPDRLAALMSGGHVFVDSDGTRERGKSRMLRGWREYFALVPDYRILVEETFAQGPTVVLLGRAEGTLVRKGRLESGNHWRVPAAWRVVIKNDKVAVWQLYVNPEPMEKIIKRVLISRDTAAR